MHVFYRKNIACIEKIVRVPCIRVTLRWKWVSHEILSLNGSKHLSTCSGKRCGQKFKECHAIINGSFGVPL
jgi:hypothetical protein